jgi:pyruvate formate lyase activating enzyme
MQIVGLEKFTMLDYPEKLACVSFSPGCNMRCNYCHNPDLVLPKKISRKTRNLIPESDFFDFLENRTGLLDAVVISGGEPTLQYDLKNFILKIRSKGFLVKLDTNGTKPWVIKELLKEKLLDYIAMDLKTGLSSYEELVRLEIKQEDLLESLYYIKTYAPDYEIRTTLIKGVHDKDEVLDEMKALLKGIKKYKVQKYRPDRILDEDQCREFRAFSDIEMLQIKNKIFDESEELAELLYH